MTSSALGSWEMASAAPAPALRGAVHSYCGYVERTAPLRRREAATGTVTVILSWKARFARLDAELLRRLDAAPEPHPAVRAAYARLAATRGAIPVGVLAEELGWSRRHLAARFRDDVGVAPKALARLLRFERALELLGERSLAEIAYECGYYDQAHFNRDFRAFAGAAPLELLARRLPGGGWSADGLPSVQDELAVAA